MKWFFCLLLCCPGSILIAQHTLPFDSTQDAPKASIADAAWVAGHWQGEIWGGIVEEIWAPPIGNAMMGSFRFVSEGHAGFYELLTISEEGESLMLRLKHFNGDLTGWEAKDEVITFPLVKVTEGALYFDGLTFVQQGENEMRVYVLGSEEGEEPEELSFYYSRYQAK